MSKLGHNGIVGHEGDLRIWHRSSGADKLFILPVETPRSAFIALSILAKYDMHLGDMIIFNMQGMEVFEDGEWTQWFDPEGRAIDEMECAELGILEFEP